MSFIVPFIRQLSADDLLIFAQVASQGSFTAAAEVLGRPKSTVSRRISSLENQLGERLFLRTTRQMRLTDFGHKLLEHALLIAEEVDAAWALSEERKQEPSGRLKVSIPSDFTNLFLSDMLAAYASLHPKVNLDLDLSSRRVDLIGEGFDLAVRIGQLPEDSLLSARKLALMPNALYASPAYLREYGQPQKPQDLHQHQLLILKNSAEHLEKWQLAPVSPAKNSSTKASTAEAQTWSENLAGRMQANSPETLMHLACKHAGIVALPCQFARPKVAAKKLVRVLPAWELPSVSVWAVFPGRKNLAAKTRSFIDMLVQSLAEI